ncbi:glycosyltransferase family 2 protein [Flavobacterium xueshanense]|uniref:Glycosyltransferase, GT2 family n=1 Tax=Flavobacterium xueshanense TaxID=935223 RepID=A0A1I2GGN3_9FLAO|nr:glycosyltransferase family 2 protein [Flavobacterium xueshanense]SFF16027.1 Glycosyltransferase, GT2 family [Flavobacterium xueshanense]
MKISKKKISFLITHYNRPLDLLKCLKAIKSLNISDSEIVVCDDASQDKHLETIKDYEIDQLIVAKTNQGLAANINKGIEACQGEYIIYCQEDFVLNVQISNLLQEFLELLDSRKVDMIRFTSNSPFNKLIPLTAAVSLIPKFSFRNFLLNYYQYSDHPFITKKSFYLRYGTYLENTSGRYGETEYAIRILKSDAKIAITKKNLASLIEGSVSVLAHESDRDNKIFTINKSYLKVGRALRLYLECFLYNKAKRGLITYKNLRQK